MTATIFYGPTVDARQAVRSCTRAVKALYGERHLPEGESDKLLGAALDLQEALDRLMLQLEKLES